MPQEAEAGGCKFQSSQGYMVRPCLKNKQKDVNTKTADVKIMKKRF
jgi:hypothetical protein